MTSPQSQIQILKVDFRDPMHATLLKNLMNQYACDPMGGGNPLSPEVLDGLPSALDKLGYAHSWLAVSKFTHSGQEEVRGVGLLNAFEGFSTFAGRKLLNIHDIIVSHNARGAGVAGLMLQEAEDFAASQGFCKLTLEVLSNNLSAQKTYSKQGFAQYQLLEAAGQAQFWEKKLIS